MVSTRVADLDDYRLRDTDYSLKIVFAVSEKGTNAAAGDYFTAIELGTSLETRFGWKVEYRAEADWYSQSQAEVIIAMLDHFDPSKLPDQSDVITVAWARNWFDRWAQRPWLDKYDILMSSSQRGSIVISENAKKLCSVFRIGTNPERFDAGKRAHHSTIDYVFTGSFWGSSRDIVEALEAIPKNLHGAIYGKNWENHSQFRHLNQGFVRYDDLPRIYAQSRLVIDDANYQTKAWGAANSRVFDALAAGCLVISNSQSVSDEVFEGLLPVYESAIHLSELTMLYTKDISACEALQKKLRDIVIKKHCYRNRAYQFKLKLNTFKRLSLKMKSNSNRGVL